MRLENNTTTSMKIHDLMLWRVNFLFFKACFTNKIYNLFKVFKSYKELFLKSIYKNLKKNF